VFWTKDRHYGLLSPRGKNRTFALFLALLGQRRRPRPPRLSWAQSLKKAFNHDPLVDSEGFQMRSFGRLAPDQIRELQLTLPCDLNLSADMLFVSRPATWRYLEELKHRATREPGQ
jgi:hypothetical protein